MRGYQTSSPTQHLTAASVLILASVVTSTWTGVKAFGINVCDLLFVVAGVLVLIESGLGGRKLLLRWWMVMPSFAALFIFAFDVIARGSTSNPVVAATTEYVSGHSAFGDQEGGGLFAARVAIATLLVAILVGSELATFGRERGIAIAKWWSLGIALSSLLAVTDSLGLTSASDFTFHQLSEGRALGLAFQPNSLAQTIAIGLPVLAYFASTARTPVHRAAWILLIGFSVTALVLTNSRGGLIVGLIALLLCTVIMAARGGRRGKLALFGLAIPSALGVFLLADWLTDNTRLGGGGGASLSDAGRWELVDAGVTAFLSNPILGAGFGNGAGVLVPLLLASSGGVVLLLGYYSFIFATYFAVFRSARSDYFLCLAFISISALLAMGLFNNSVNERYNFVIVAVAATWVLLGEQPLPRGQAARSQRGMVVQRL